MTRPHNLKLAFLLALASAYPAQAAPKCPQDADGGACVWGRVEGIEAAALTLRGLRVELAGVEPPGRAETCVTKSSNSLFDCGQPARRKLAELIKGGVACEIVDAAQGNLIGRCRGNDGDLAVALVQAGLLRAHDRPYEAAMQQAVQAKAGLWSPDILPPRDWERLRGKAEKAER